MPLPRAKGEGSRCQRTDGRWCGAATIGVRADGRRLRRYLDGHTQAVVLAKVRALTVRQTARGVAAPSVLTAAHPIETCLRPQQRSCERRIWDGRRITGGTMRIASATIALALAAVLAPVGHASAGTKNFVLVNKTGAPIHNLYLSESANDNWGEDLLGQDVLAEGASVEIGFSGKKTCIWDLMVKDEDGEALYWRKIDLCTTARVVLNCAAKKCWATFE